MLGEPLRQDDQCGPCGRIVDREKGLQELEGVASDRSRLRRCYVQHRSTPRRGRAVSRSNSAGRLQLYYIATPERSPPLVLATRHHAFPTSKLQEGRAVNSHANLLYHSPSVINDVVVFY